MADKVLVVALDEDGMSLMIDQTTVLEELIITALPEAVGRLGTMARVVGHSEVIDFR